MRSHLGSSFLLVAFLSSLAAACGDDSASLGGQTSPAAPSDPSVPAQKCEIPKSWSNTEAEGVMLTATAEASGTIDSMTIDATHVYYIFRATDGAGTSQLKRVSLDGGAAETLATVGRALGSDLILHGDAVLFDQTNAITQTSGLSSTGRSALLSVPKAGGAPSVLFDGAPIRTFSVDATTDEVYVATGAPNDDVLAVRVNDDGTTTPAVRAPKDIAPFGIKVFAVVGKMISWIPAQSRVLTTNTPPGDFAANLVADAAVYITDVADPSSRLTLFGPYSKTWVGGIAMDAAHVYFGSVWGLTVADVKTAGSAKPFGAQEGTGKPYAVRLDGDMLYWQTLIPQGNGASSIGRVPKNGGAGEWLVESERNSDFVRFAVGSCKIVYAGSTTAGNPAIFARPTAVPGREGPVPSAVGIPSTPGAGVP